MGYKVFQNGTALTAEVMNDLIMEQAVPTFSSATERDNTVPSPNDGQHCYLVSTKETYKYVAGRGWVALLGENVGGLTARTTLVCTSTTRPAHAAGRTIFETDSRRTWVSDGTNWIRPNGVPVFSTLAERNSYFPAPIAGDTCLCLGTTMTHDGTAWRFMLGGTTSITTDSNGFGYIPHGAGQAPRFAPVVGLTPATTEGQNGVVKVMAWNGADATNLVVRFYRTDQSAAFNNPGLSVAFLATF
jgi:hypothetical protein